MKILKTDLPQVLIFEPTVFKDQRGFFMEMYSQKRYQDAGILPEFVQDNISASGKNVLRGLHYQLNFPQAKLISVLRGKVWDVVVDIRKNSPHFGKWISVELSEENNRQVFVPAGFAHGYCTLSDEVLFHYKCSDYYHPEDERGILWSDDELKIQWPATEPLVSDKDKKYPILKEAVLPRR